MSQFNLLKSLYKTPTAWLGLNFRKVVSPTDGALNQYMIVRCYHIIQDKQTGKYEVTVSNLAAYDGDFEYPSHNEEGEPFMDTIFYGGIEPIEKCREYWKYKVKQGYKPHSSLNIDLSPLATSHEQLIRVNHTIQGTL